METKWGGGGWHENRMVDGVTGDDGVRCGCVTGAFRPDGLAFTRPCKIFQAKVFKE